MATPTDPNAKAFEVLSQAPGVSLDRQGQAVQGITITFRTARGNQSTVFVSRADYTPENARQAILEHAQALDAVSALTG